MNISSSTSPLGQRIQHILLERNHQPIALLELQTLLRRQGHPVPADRLRTLLADPAIFTALADDRYILRDQFDGPAEMPMLETIEQPIYLANLALAQTTYIVLDIETSGLDSAHDHIFQIATLLVIKGQPVQFQEWYLYCDLARIPPALRRTLHLTDDLLATIAAAPTLETQAPEIYAFLARHPLVIHNARFDTAFLRHYLPALENKVVDSMELALLVAPDAPRHKLSTLAEHFDIALDSIVIDMIPGIPAGYRISAETLHNAKTDVLLLNIVYRELLCRWRATDPPLNMIYATLLPEAWGTTTDQQLDLAMLLPEPDTPAPLDAPFPNADAQTLLERYLVHSGRDVRASQQTMVQLIADAFMQDESRLIEAPTGTGKTLGYLLPAIWAARQQGRRIAIATRLKNLQDQARGEVAKLQEVFPFRAQVLKGAASYLCLRDLQQALHDATEADLERRYILAFLARWATTKESITLDELPYWLTTTLLATREIAREVAVDRATCTERRCPFFDRCHLFSAYRQAEQADILLINQSLWLTEPSMMPPFDALVIDEAHNLEDTATSALQQEVSEASLRRLLHRLHVPGTRRGVLQRILELKPDDELRATIHRMRRGVGQSLRLIAELHTTLVGFVKDCDERLDPERGARLRLAGAAERVYPIRWKVVQQALDQIWRVYMHDIISGLQSIAAALPAEEYTLWRMIEAARQALIDQGQLLTNILQARHTGRVSWIAVATSGREQGWGFYDAPITVAPLLAARYRERRSVILTSATLTTGPHNFKFFVERLGLHELLGDGDFFTLDGALPYATNVLLGLPSYLSYTPAQATIQSYVEEFADELALLCRYTDGRTLALFTARTRLEQVWERNHAQLEEHGIAVLAQRADTSRHSLAEQFREHGGAVLYGLKSFWEGIDIPGAALSFVVMEKLPYPAFNDPIHTARCEAIRQRSGREFQDYLFPLMVIQFKQGFGRLLRDKDDQGAVILYDKRVARKSYLRDLLDALPGYQARDQIAERSRRNFYKLIATRLPGLIDQAAKAELLAELPDILPTDLEALVERLALPDPLPDADYDNWRPRILEAIKQLYGHEIFRSAEQEAALRAMLSGTDVVAILPTGAGKSLCFQLPALLRHGTTIICSPLIALMRDQIEKLHERGIEIAAALMSGQSAAEREEVLARVRTGSVRLLYLAPERLRDPIVLAALAAAPIRQVVVDEAHCVALWGPSFRPDFLVLPQVYGRWAQRPPIAAFTATATPLITSAIEQGLRLHNPQVVRASINRPELRLVVFDSTNRYHPIRSKTDQIRRLILLVQTADLRGEAMLIYVATTNQAEYLARLIQVAGYAARAYHGKMPVQERANVGELFMEGLINIVVCTKAFGMGIDKPDIRYVVHFNVPGDLESYAQEVGRAGRDGQPAYAILLYHPSDERIQRFFIEQSRPDGELLTNIWRRIGEQPIEWTLHPQSTCEQFDIDELALRRAIYLLEHAGLIQRGADVTIRGNLTLLGDWPNLLSLIDLTAWPLLERLRDALPALAWSPQEIVLADVAMQIGCTPAALEAALIELSVVGGCLYRPWEKGYQIVRLTAPETRIPPVGIDTVAVQENKLRQMRAFVVGTGCRWQMLRRYFGEEAGAPCGNCDRCAAEQIYPWSGKTGRDVPDISDFLDLATTLLEVAEWNTRRIQESHAPFGASTLVRILRGEEYALMRYATTGPAADARRRALRACPYWGVCRTLRRSAEELNALFDRLIHENYLELIEAQVGNDTTYQYARLTERGRAQLLSGERLGW